MTGPAPDDAPPSAAAGGRGADDADDRAGQAIDAAVTATLGAPDAPVVATGLAARRAAHVIAAIQAHRPPPDERARPDAPTPQAG